jgi:phage terminase large subunit-like protein
MRLEPAWRTLLGRLRDMDEDARRRALARLPQPALRAIVDEWHWGVLDGQQEPQGDWRTWLIMAGRGYGKTRAGAEWIWARARDTPAARIALVGATLDDVARVMVEGESGLLAVARCDEMAVWRPTRGELRFPSGAIAQAFSGADPKKLRGPQHHFAWCDELAKWARPQATWDNLKLGLRLDPRARAVVTTTPAPILTLRRIAAAKDTRLTAGRTADNPHLAAGFAAAMLADYGGTRLGRQELDGMLFEDVEGALWTRALIEQCRVKALDAGARRRVVIGVDPPASAQGDACGIVVCGLGEDGIAYVLADRSEAGLSPNGWARRVAETAQAFEADRVIAEKNNGGDMVGSVLAGVDAELPVRLVSASRGKAARAEPIVSRFERGEAKFAGRFPELEDELCGLTIAGGYAGPGRSPDRADAMIWAMTELGKARVAPRIRRL